MTGTLTAIDDHTQEPITGFLQSVESHSSHETQFVTLLVDGHIRRARISRQNLAVSGARPRDLVFTTDVFLWRVIENDICGLAEHAFAELHRREVSATESADRAAGAWRYVMLDSAAALRGSAVAAR